MGPYTQATPTQLSGLLRGSREPYENHFMIFVYAMELGQLGAPVIEQKHSQGRRTKESVVDRKVKGKQEG